MLKSTTILTMHNTILKFTKYQYQENLDFLLIMTKTSWLVFDLYSGQGQRPV